MGCLNKKTVPIMIISIAIGIYFSKEYFNGPMCESQSRIDGKVVIVTGANTGIGKETVRDLVQRGGKVYMACRSLEKAREAANDIKATTGIDDSNFPIMHLDLASLESIRNFVKEFKQKEKKLDILINNAGMVTIFGSYATTTDGFETHFGVNHLGHFLLTHLLVDLLVTAAPSRVVSVAAEGHRFVTGIQFDDIMYKNNFQGYTAYLQTKLANVLFMKELGRRLDGAGVTTYALCPGAVNTEILSNHINIVLEKVLLFLLRPFLKDLKHGAQTSVCCAVDEKLATETGKYYSDCAEKEPSEAAQDAEAAKKLWDLSVELVKLEESEIHPLLQALA